MARLHSSIPPPKLSVLDRLLDDEPSARESESQLDYNKGLALMRSAVVRDLQWLLNARIGWAPEYEGSRDEDPLKDTVVRLGLPDITTTDLKSEQECEFLRRRIRESIPRFEPRLDFITVELGGGDAVRGRTHFKVTARLRVDPEPVKLTFDATVVWKNRTVEVRAQ